MYFGNTCLHILHNDIQFRSLIFVCLSWAVAWVYHKTYSECPRPRVLAFLALAVNQSKRTHCLFCHFKMYGNPSPWKPLRSNVTEFWNGMKQLWKWSYQCLIVDATCLTCGILILALWTSLGWVRSLHVLWNFDTRLPSAAEFEAWLSLILQTKQFKQTLRICSF